VAVEMDEMVPARSFDQLQFRSHCSHSKKDQSGCRDI
jgi:hypothetical protein